MLGNLLLILAALAFTLGLRSYQHPVMQKLGALGIFATSFLAGYLLSGSWLVGMAAASIWLLLPWLDLLTRIRKLTLPLEHRLRHKSPPNAQNFPALGDLTDEVEEEGFEYVDDTGWDGENYQQFFRLYYKNDERLQAAICLVDQSDIAFYYVSLSSRGKDGKIWTTWNYPFSYSLRLAPQWQVNRLRGDLSFLELCSSHRDFLQRHGVAAEQLTVLDAEGMQTEIQNDLQKQVAHNLATGVLRKTGAGQVQYSWRGLMYLWLQFLRDLVRLT